MANAVRRVAKNILSLVSRQVIEKLVAFLVMVYIARVLGPTVFGKLSFAFVMLSYFLLFSDFGLITFAVREVSRYKERVLEYAGQIISLRFLISLLAFFILNLINLLLPLSLDKKIIVCIYSLTLVPLAFNLNWVFQAFERMEYPAGIGILSTVIYAALAFFFIRWGLQIYAVPWAFLISQIILVALPLALIWKWYGRLKIKYVPEVWKSTIRQAFPIGFSMLMINIYYNFDTIMLSFMKGDEVVGWYNAAYKIVLFIISIASIIITVFFPILSRLYQDNLEKLRIASQKYVKLLVTLGVPIGVGGIILASPLIRLFYASAYDNAVLAFQILILTATVIYINVAYGNPLLAWDRQSIYVKIITLGAITNLVFNFILIPPFSLYGAAAATLLAELVVFAGVYINFQKVLKISLPANLIRPLLASAGMGVAIYFLRNYHVIYLVILGTILYFAFLLILGGFTKEDRELLGQLVRREIE